MFVSKPRKLALTLLFSVVLALALAGSSQANGVTLHRRDHLALNRMIRKRVPANNPVDPIAQGAAPNPPSNDPTQSSASSSNVVTSSASSSSQVVSSSSTSSSSTSTSTSLSTSSSESSSATSTTQSVSHTSTTSTTTSTSTTSTTPLSSVTQPAATQPVAASNTALSPTTAVDQVTETSHVPGATQSSSNDSSTQEGSSLSHTAITVLIVIASSIGGTAVIWTIIRKWKFRPSSQFEDRLEPINWQPDDHDSGIPVHRRAPSNASSFHSSGHEGSGLSRSNSAYGATSDVAPGLPPLPDHDFTAGASSLAPVGGYADLARGPSPQPQMQEALTRGPSLNRGFDQYGMAPHHQGGYATQNAYDYNGPSY